MLGLLVCLVLGILPSLARDAACDDLRGLYEAHGDILLQYLNKDGRSCVESTESASLVSLAEPIWSESGHGNDRISVSLEFSNGIYNLTLLEPAYVAGWGTAKLLEINAVPDGCFPSSWGVSFPAQVLIRNACTVYATLNVEQPRHHKKGWKVSISRQDELPPAEPQAHGWSVTGYGQMILPVDHWFEPGIYRIGADVDANGHSWTYWFEYSDHANYCPSLPRHPRLPVQFRIEERCKVTGVIVTGYNGSEPTIEWEIAISKLN